MSQKPLHGKPPVPETEPPITSPPTDDAPEAEALGESAAGSVDQPVAEPDPDPYDELWDPDMDTRPERIRKTRVRARTDARPRGGGPPRAKRKEGP